MGRTARQQVIPRASAPDSHSNKQVPGSPGTSESGTCSTVQDKPGSRKLWWRDRSHWQFNSHELDKYVRDYGPFTVDACAASSETAQAPKFYTNQKSFCQADVSGESVWLNVPFRRTGQSLRHYLQCKSKAADRTSAVLVVPKWTDTWWWQLTKDMKTLAEYPAGVSMFSMAPLKESDPWVDMKPPTWATVVLWDPPAETQQNKVCADEQSPQTRSEAAPIKWTTVAFYPAVTN